MLDLSPELVIQSSDDNSKIWDFDFDFGYCFRLTRCFRLVVAVVVADVLLLSVQLVLRRLYKLVAGLRRADPKVQRKRSTNVLSTFRRWIHTSLQNLYV